MKLKLRENIARSVNNLSKISILVKLKIRKNTSQRNIHRKKKHTRAVSVAKLLQLYKICKVISFQPMKNNLILNVNIAAKKLATVKRLQNHISQCHSSHVVCEICQKQISNPYELKRHKVFVHKVTEGAWFCDKCPKNAFFSKATFLKHMKDKH